MRAVLRATRGPSCSRMNRSAKSYMALKAAVVVTPPSVTTKLSGRRRTSGYRRANRSANNQDVVASRPPSSPASAIRKAPTQSDTTAVPEAACDRIDDTSGPRSASVASRSSVGESSKPGTIRTSTGRTAETSMSEPPDAITRRRGETTETS
ncbi:hypothetical protein A6A29_30250 [Streptomyces sp. TSRI0281]|nr:hypothetical protein A6A29_30250 [Streptomyces sp. TSRI0281]